MFAYSTSRDRHVRGQNCLKKKANLWCRPCNRKFSRPSALKRHEKLLHSGAGAVFLCGMCDKTFGNKEVLREHRRIAHAFTSDFVLQGSAHNSACELYRLVFPQAIKTLDEALHYANKRAKNLLIHLVKRRQLVKASFAISLRFAKPDFRPQDDDGGVDGREGDEVITMVLRSKQNTLNTMDFPHFRESIISMHQHIITTFDDFVENGSGWVLVDCLSFDVGVGQCASLSGSCDLHAVVYKKQSVDVTTPQELSCSQDGQRCFYLAIAAYFLPDKKACKMSLESFVAAQICEVLRAPVELSKISKFEEANEHLDLGVNVIFKSENGELYPARASPKITAKHCIVLLMYFTKNEDAHGNPVLHYALVEDLGNLLSTRGKSVSGAAYTHRKHFCFNCFTSFARSESLAAHVEWCHKEEGQVFTLPKEGETIKYEKKWKESKIAYTFFFDFETIQATPGQECSCAPELLHKCKHKTKVVSEHVAFAFSLIMINRDGEVVEEITHVGEDTMEVFIKALYRINKEYTELLNTVTPITMTDEQELAFQGASCCHICNTLLGNDRVRDHDHQSGRYLGAAHKVCNFNRVECKKIVGFAHNFSGYDSHLIMNALAECDTEFQLSAIPLNMEKFKMLRVENCILMDSMAFLGASLDKLVNTLQLSNHSFPYISKWFKSDREKCLVLRKGIYPYEYITSMARVTDTHELPPPDAFHSRLSGRNVSETDYAHAQTVWREFACASMVDYTKLYVLTDTILLAEAVLELRESLWSEFGIDMMHYLSIPMMTKDIMLKTTGVEMELMTDIDMIHMVRSNIRGGLSYVNHRHFHVARENERRDYDSSVVYVDANNLYGAAMRFPLPLRDFRWMGEEELQALDASTISEHSDTGFILEVTLDYPENLHLAHSSFPLAPHQMEITQDHLSPYARDALQSLGKKGKYKAKKLTSTFHRREKYVCHGLNLRLYLELGMKLVAVHRGITFHQAPFIRSYIDMCTQKRAEAVSKTRSNMMKLLCNSLYGKVSSPLKRCPPFFLCYLVSYRFFLSPSR